MSNENMAVGYEDMRFQASRMSAYTPVRVSLDVALKLAEQAPYPRAVKVGIMTQIANNKYVTLRQMQILLGWAADRAQR